MIDIQDRWHGATDRQRWAARGTAFMAKVKATKAVWLSPAPGTTGKKATSTARKTARRTTTRTTGSARRKTGAAKKATTKSA